jgi:hypothetical protein
MVALQEDSPVSLTLELTGDRSEKDVSSGRVKSVERVQTDAKSFKFIVSMPRLVDANQANLTADLLFEEIDRLPTISVVECVILKGLRFTSEGVAGIIMFLMIHAEKVKHVILNDIFSGVVIAHEDPLAFSSLASAFESSKLESLNLSNNVVESCIWKNWIQQTELQQLLLDHVEMSDASLQALASNFVFGQTLRELHVVLSKPMGKAALDAANTIVGSCTQLTSLRWINKNHVKDDTRLPWIGLQRMTATRSSTHNSGKLLHLIMEGGCLSDEDLGDMGLYGALLELPSLQTLKLRHVGLRDAAVHGMVAAMRSSQPPLVCLDLSCNNIQSDGAKMLVDLAHIRRVTKDLTSLVLEKNLIANDGARTLISSFGSNLGARLDLRLRGNPFDYSKIAYEMAVSKGSVELERDELRKECERLRTEAHDGHQKLRKVMAAQTLMVSDMHVLKQQAECVAEERETLSKAFSVLGKGQQVEERKEMLHRIGKLEEMVLGNSAFATFPSSSPPRQPKSDGSGRRGVTTQSLGNERSVARHTSMPSIGERSDGSGRRAVATQSLTLDRLISRRTSMPSIGEEQALALNASNSNSNNNSNNNMHEQRHTLKRSTSLEVDESKNSVPLYTSHSHSLPQYISPTRRHGNALQRSTSERWGVFKTSIPKGSSSSTCIPKGSSSSNCSTVSCSSTPNSTPSNAKGGRQLSLPQLRTQSLQKAAASARGARSNSLDIQSRSELF